MLLGLAAEGSRLLPYMPQTLFSFPAPDKKINARHSSPIGHAAINLYGNIDQHALGISTRIINKGKGGPFVQGLDTTQGEVCLLVVADV